MPFRSGFNYFQRRPGPTVSPAVGDVTVSPAAAGLVAASINPTVILGSVTISPPALTVIAASAAPTVIATGEYSLRFYGGGNSSNVDKVYIPCGPSDAINVGQGDFTVEFWVRCSASLQDGGATAGANYSWIDSPIVFDRDLLGSVGSGGDWGISLTDGRVTFGLQNSAGSQRTIMGTTDLRDDAWHHVAVTRVRSSGDMAVYVDGAREANQASGPSGDVHVASNAAASTYNPFMCIGGEKHAIDWPAGQFAGYVDEIRISDSIRYTGTSYTVPAANFTDDANTVGLFHFNEGSGTTVNDDSGNNNDGSFTVGGAGNGPTWETTWPFASVTFSPVAVTAVAANVAPSVILGAVSVTPNAVTLVAANVAPSVILGAVSVTPNAVTLVAANVAPSVILGALTLSPAAADAVAGNVAPAVILGALVVSPSAAAAVAASADPAVILGAVLITPGAVTLVALTINPDTVLGPVSVTPAPAGAVALTINPTVDAGGNLTLSPAAGEAVAGNLAPTVILGSLTLSPAAGDLVAGVVAPSVILGALALTPGAAALVALTVDPSVVITGPTITPAPASAVGATVAPTVILGSLVIIPGPAGVIVATAGPTVALSDLEIVTLDFSLATGEELDFSLASAAGVLNFSLATGGGVLL